MYSLVHRPRVPPNGPDTTPPLPPEPTGPRILLVEDTDALRASAVRTLAAQGYAVTEARHGQDALDVMARAAAPFDVVVTDVSMPVMSGYKLGRRLAECRPGLPVVYMSSAPREMLLRCGLPPGPTTFLRKPFRPEDLVREVAALIPERG
jgi:two-component system cell cycle sensor histidine kinase/response regulator CckA